MSDIADVHVGQARILVGWCHERQRYGWHLPGSGFTTSWARAMEVALRVDNLIKSATQKGAKA